ncbi:hypothetical protein [Pseudochrobactrum sp. MP213Fo]|uniref:hypothetical protein n=1 Tax=Pseudochrobactrum sp. MP213Fo TaxID=3022250 RepID=UPI003B9FE92F
MNKSENDFSADTSLSDKLLEGDALSGHARLKNAVRQAKAAQADRLDSITDIREADIARLEMLVQDLQPVFDAVPVQDEQWDFCLNHGMQPRLWLDASAFVMISRDRRSYRFVRDTRSGRLVLAESPDIKVISAAVTRYIALRIIERERLMDDIAPDAADGTCPKAEKPADQAAEDQRSIAAMAKTQQAGSTFISSLLWFVGGALLGCGLLMLLFQHYGISLPILR